MSGILESFWEWVGARRKGIITQVRPGRDLSDVLKDIEIGEPMFYISRIQEGKSRGCVSGLGRYLGVREDIVSIDADIHFVIGVIGDRTVWQLKTWEQGNVMGFDKGGIREDRTEIHIGYSNMGKAADRYGNPHYEAALAMLSPLAKNQDDRLRTRLGIYPGV